jgi:hypothetical protein
MKSLTLKAFVGAIALAAGLAGAQDAAKPAEGAKPAEAAAPAAAAEGMEPIKIELPEAFFGGTPTDYWSANLEQEDFKKRPDFLAPKGTTNVAKGKAVSSSTNDPVMGELSQLTDGDKDYVKKSLVELEKGVQWVQVDLEQPHNVYAIVVWHFHEGKRVYFDIVAQVSDDPNFKENVTTVYNNDLDNSAGLGVGPDKEYIENNKGRLIDAKGAKGRYVRLYSQGNTNNDMNHYIEVEVYGKPAA